LRKDLYSLDEGVRRDGSGTDSIAKTAFLEVREESLPMALHKTLDKDVEAVSVVRSFPFEHVEELVFFW